MSDQREAGWYWVRPGADTIWEPAEYIANGQWALLRRPRLPKDYVPAVIGPRLTPPKGDDA